MPQASVGDLFGRMIMDASRFEAGIGRSDRALQQLERSVSSARTTTGTLNTSTQRLERGLTTLGVANTRTGAAFLTIGRGAGAAGLAIGAVATAATLATAAVVHLAVAMGSRLLRSVISVGSFAENARLQLDAILGSAEQGARAFELLNREARALPQTLQEIIAGAGSLGSAAGGSADELARLVRIAADIQATFPQLSFQEVASNLQRAMTAGIASAELFRERGISAMLGFQAGATVSAAETRQRIIEQWEQATGGMVGASERMASTWTGIVSQLEDTWFRFRLQVGEAGTFDAAEEGLADILEALNRLEASGALAALAGTISDLLVPVIDTAASALVTLLGWVNENERAIRVWGTTAFETIRVMGVALVNLAQIAATPGQAFIQSAEAMREAVSGNFDAARERMAAFRAEVASVGSDFQDMVNAINQGAARIANVASGRDVFDRFMEQMFGRGEETAQVEPQFGTRTSTAGARKDPFQQAIERLSQGRREIAALEAALEGTSVAFDATAERAQLLETTIRAIAGLDLSTAQRAQLDELITEWLRYEDTIESTDAAVRRLIESLDDATIGTPTSAALEAAARQGELARERFQRHANDVEDAASRVSQSVGDAFTSLITHSQSFLASFRGIVDAIIAEILRLTLIRNLTNFLTNLLAPIPGAPAEVPRPDFARGFQHGGPVRAGEVAIVGEAGPELFVPQSAGNIVPTAPAGGGDGRGGTVYNVTFAPNVQAWDSKDVDRFMRQNGPTLMRTMLDQARKNSGARRMFSAERR